jgi:hypothetical protein
MSLLLKRKIPERFSCTHFQFDEFGLWRFFLQNTIDFAAVEEAMRADAGMKYTRELFR